MLEVDVSKAENYIWISTQQDRVRFNHLRTLFSIVLRRELHTLCWGVCWRASQLQTVQEETGNFLKDIKFMASTTKLLALALAWKPSLI